MSLAMERTREESVPLAIETTNPPSVVWWSPKGKGKGSRRKYNHEPDFKRARGDSDDDDEQEEEYNGAEAPTTGCGLNNQCCRYCHSGCRGGCCRHHP